jgi:predicted nucleic acid-binding protein
MDPGGTPVSMVLDASMALAWLFERAKPDERQRAERALEKIGDTETIVPSLWYIEVANALLVGERRKVVTEALVIDYLTRLDALPIVEDDVSPALRRDQVMALARQHHLTAYDAIYLELALRKGAVLATFDIQLANAIRAAGGREFDQSTD